MAKVQIRNLKNKPVGELELDDAVFDYSASETLVWEAVQAFQAGRRKGTHKTKNRVDVRGGGGKPWRQKGTGRARVGEARNPLWRTGGVGFGPQPRSYAYPLPKKVIRGGLRAALTQKFKEAAVLVVDQLTAEEPRTRHAAELLNRLDLTGKALLVDVKPDANLSLAVRNISGIRISSTRRLSARDVVDAGWVVMTRAAVERLEQVLAS